MLRGLLFCPCPVLLPRISLDAHLDRCISLRLVIQLVSEWLVEGTPLRCGTSLDLYRYFS